MTPTYLGFVSIQVRDLEQSREFYTNLLGFKQSDMINPAAVVFEQAAGAVFAIRKPLVNLDAVSQLGHGVALWFGVADIEQNFQSFQAKGGKVVQAIQDTPFGKTFVVADPDGYQITIQQTP
jgi:predicted enzyme related to lactoylglutathione lyase